MMRYMRCRCGKKECWTTTGHPACGGCTECDTTLEEAPTHHRPVPPHDTIDEHKIDRKTGETWQERRCVRCQHKEEIPGSRRKQV